jgi:hypothetical protein
VDFEKVLRKRLEIYQERKLNGLHFFMFQAWGCSNFVEISFRDDGLCQDAEPISEIYFRGLGDADHHTRMATAR